MHQACYRAINTPYFWHDRYRELDGSSRIVLPRDLRQAAAISKGQKLKAYATPGRIILEVEPNPGKVRQRGKLKTWTGRVPATPVEEAVDVVRHYER